MLLAGLFLAQHYLDAAVPQVLADQARRDKTVRRVAQNHPIQLFSTDPTAESAFQACRFPLRLIDQRSCRLHYLATLILLPTFGEWRLAHLPRSLWFAYYLLRPIRLATKYTIGRVMRGSQARALPRTEVSDLETDSVVVRSEELTLCRIEGIPIILRLGERRTYALDEMGCRIWDALAQPLRVADLLLQVGVPGGDEATLDFLRQLGHEDLIRVVC